METADSFRLETERMVTRCWRAEDWRAFLPVTTDPEVMRHIADGQVFDAERTRGWIDKQRRNQERFGYSLWPACDRSTEEVIGMCGLQQLGTTGEVEIGWWLAREHWGRGLATEVAQRVLLYGFEELRLPRIVAIAHPENGASVAIMKKLGMARLGQMTLGELGKDQYADLEVVYYGVEAPI